MSLFGKLLGRGSSAPAVQIDPCRGDSLARAWRDRLARGEWSELAPFLRSFDNVDARDFYIEVLADSIDGRPAWLDTWVGQEPEAALPRLFRGRRGVAWAWDARGGGQVDTVKDDGWSRFFERLQGAEDDVTVATRLDPADAGPWVVLLTTTRGLQQGQGRLREVYAEAQRRWPWHQEAHRLMVQGLAAKWGGSNEAMFGFAREAHAHAPEGLGVHTVLAEAHIEGWMDADQDNTYWERPGVREDIMAAADSYLYSSRRVMTPREVGNRSIFAYCFWKLGERECLREQLGIIGDTLTVPWTLFSRPAVVFAAARRDAGY